VSVTCISYGAVKFGRTRDSVRTPATTPPAVNKRTIQIGGQYGIPLPSLQANPQTHPHYHSQASTTVRHSQNARRSNPTPLQRMSNQATPPTHPRPTHVRLHQSERVPTPTYQRRSNPFLQSGRL